MATIDAGVDARIRQFAEDINRDVEALRSRLFSPMPFKLAQGATAFTMGATDASTAVATMAAVQGVVAAGVKSPFRNLLINGDHQVSLYNGTNAVTPTASTYVVDHWSLGVTKASKLTAQKVAGLNGAPAAIQITTASAYAPGASDYFYFGQPIEAQFIADLLWGTAAAKPVTISFTAKASIAGIYSGSIRKSSMDICYPFTFTIENANVAQKVSVTIPGATTGDWNSYNPGLLFDLGSGSYYRGNPNAWQADGFVGCTNAVEMIATAGATLQLTDIQLEAGTQATPFERLPYDVQLLRAMRYHERIVGSQGWIGYQQTTGTPSVASQAIPFKVRKRISAINLSYSSLSNFSVAGNTASAVTLSGNADFWSFIQVASGSGSLTQYNCVRIVMDSSGWVDAQAELSL